MAEKISTTKKSVSFRDDVLAYAQSQADKFHGGNLSGYLTFLISSNKYGMTMASKDTEVIDAEEKIRENVNKFQKSEVNEDYIDQFLEI
ncbi:MULTISPECIES: hypothetical protein [Bacillaceae]|uniref:hypothetical protein n=1 Tax=Bacillaceae TaxID=186817 RepID=UPI001BE977F4|nr:MULTISPECIES: hypothetical protein [Bacillaceae]MBT2604507.1 hypothetical protein [Bacillus sp. ISL-53]MDW7617560.1 hypothetical protein [Peribacillus simplex]USL11126.1 hypothetical protein LIT24_29490 [Bacillus bombysepticus]